VRATLFLKSSDYINSDRILFRWLLPQIASRKPDKIDGDRDPAIKSSMIRSSLMRDKFEKLIALPGCAAGAAISHCVNHCSTALWCVVKVVPRMFTNNPEWLVEAEQLTQLRRAKTNSFSFTPQPPLHQHHQSQQNPGQSRQQRSCISDFLPIILEVQGTVGPQLTHRYFHVVHGYLGHPPFQSSYTGVSQAILPRVWTLRSTENGFAVNVRPARRTGRTVCVSSDRGESKHYQPLIS
jgi:hypothetical protein